MVITTVLIRIAAIAPSVVAFHNHQVVPAFHTSMVKKIFLKRTGVAIPLLASNNKGTQAMAIIGVRDESGQAAINNSAANKLNAIDCIGFND